MKTLLILLLLATGAPAGENATLAWDPSSAPGVAGYRLYWGTASGTYSQSKDVGKVTRTTVSGLAPGSTYYFVVTAYNAGALQTAPSNEAVFNAVGGNLRVVTSP